jgi:hypothetical protein
VHRGDTIAGPSPEPGEASPLLTAEGAEDRRDNGRVVPSPFSVAVAIFYAPLAREAPIGQGLLMRLVGRTCYARSLLRHLAAYGSANRYKPVKLYTINCLCPSLRRNCELQVWTVGGAHDALGDVLLPVH